MKIGIIGASPILMQELQLALNDSEIKVEDASETVAVQPFRCHGKSFHSKKPQQNTRKPEKLVFYTDFESINWKERKIENWQSNGKRKKPKIK